MGALSWRTGNTLYGIFFNDTIITEGNKAIPLTHSSETINFSGKSAFVVYNNYLYVTIFCPNSQTASKKQWSGGWRELENYPQTVEVESGYYRSGNTINQIDGVYCDVKLGYFSSLDGNVENYPLFYNLDDYHEFIFTQIIPYTSNGGGATHIAKVTGQLKDLSSNLSDILMVSGGGGGGLLVGETDYSGKEAGGISGSGDNSADQSTGNAFGQGESGTNASGGGSGLYGGYKGTSAKSGGAGSGYIGNSLLSNKKMVGYNVPTSSAEGTKTESVNEVSVSAVSGKPKSGNGFAKIKFLRDS